MSIINSEQEAVMFERLDAIYDCIKAIEGKEDCQTATGLLRTLAMKEEAQAEHEVDTLWMESMGNV